MDISTGTFRRELIFALILIFTVTSTLSARGGFRSGVRSSFRYRSYRSYGHYGSYSSGLSAGAISGYVFGGIAGVIFFLILFCLLKKGCRDRAQPSRGVTGQSSAFSTPMTPIPNVSQTLSPPQYSEIGHSKDGPYDYNQDNKNYMSPPTEPYPDDYPKEPPPPYPLSYSSSLYPENNANETNSSNELSAQPIANLYNIRPTGAYDNNGMAT